MRLLLDTHALIWLLAGDPRLAGTARAAIEDAASEVFVSAATAWEIATKHRKGKLPHAAYLVENYLAIIADQGIGEVAITSAHALRSGSLALPNPDPFDRIIVAQALLEGMPVVSNEASWDEQGVRRIWA